MNQPTTLRASKTTIVLNKVKTFFSKPHNVILLLLGIVLTFTTVAPIVAIVEDTFKIHAGTIDAHLTGQASGFASPSAIAAARPSQPGYPQPPQLLPGNASRTLISFSSIFTLNFSLATPRRIPAKIPTIPMTAAAYKIDAPISSPPLNQTIQSKESDCHKTGCDQHDRRSFEAFRYIVFINFLPDTCHYDDCNCKSDCGEHTVDDRFPDV